jgi:hypothetical protein
MFVILIWDKENWIELIEYAGNVSIICVEGYSIDNQNELGRL